jgi:hypothetical protein
VDRAGVLGVPTDGLMAGAAFAVQL